MRVTITNSVCTVTKEPGDPICSGVVNAKGESRLLYHIKNELNAQGYNLIKKRMYKDGHLVDDTQQYLRTRKPSGNPEKNIYIYNASWAIHGAEELYNKKGVVYLSVIKDIFNVRNK